MPLATNVSRPDVVVIVASPVKPLITRRKRDTSKTPIAVTVNKNVTVLWNGAPV